ncbi:hypothetical protein AWN90_18725 [Nocardia terpenica]|uniref:Uncharacterized protein n=1 Tax=Nocardia terpenica TaxID=455432 RepID=A0A164PDB5_9NOCA|nr:hypothetical protein AWN90_18725 [Nocardia terpenica]
MLGQMRIVEDHEIGRLDLGAAVEVDPVVHYTDCLSLVVVVHLGTEVSTSLETVNIDSGEPTRLGLYLRSQLFGAREVCDRHAQIQRPICDQERNEGLALTSR